MPNVFTGGRKLTTIASVESGLREIGNHKNHTDMSISITGIISDCASRMSFTAAPAAIMIEPIVKNASRKKMNRYTHEREVEQARAARTTTAPRARARGRGSSR